MEIIMQYTVIAKTGAMLVDIIRKALVPDLVKYDEQIGLCSPSDKGDCAVGVFLYDIAECSELKTHTMVTLDSQWQRYPSAYFNLYYMITAYSNSDIKYKAQEEAILLGKVLQCLMDTSVIDWAQAADEDAENDLPTQITLLPLTMEEKCRIFPIQNRSFQPSLFYEVGPVALASEKTRVVKRVVDAAYSVTEKEHR